MTTTKNDFLRGKNPEPDDWRNLAMELKTDPGLRTLLVGEGLVLKVFREHGLNPIREVHVPEDAARWFGRRR